MERKSSFHVIWSLPAIRDLLKIRDHLITENPRALAESSVLRIHALGNGLFAHPYMWRERNEIASGIRLAPVHPYFICYRLLGNYIQVVRVIHEKRDVVAMLASSENRI